MPRGLAHLWIVIHDLVSVVVRFLPLRFASLQTHRWLPVQSVRMPAGLAAERDKDGWRRRLLRSGLPAIIQNPGSSSGTTCQPLRIVCASPSSMARAASTNESAFLPAPRTDSAKARTSVSSPVVVWDESLIVSEYSMTGNTSMPRTCRRNGCFVGS
ncbi:unknown [Eggerthella sp. CAG:1427]|nr:unknown [Eggerthella sp. CAG:1427]